MFSLSQKTKSKEKPSPSFSDDEGVCRIVLDAEGRIVHANAAFYELCDLIPGEESGKPVTALLDFQGRVNSPADLTPGLYTAYARGVKGSLQLQFDWLPGVDHKRYLVGCLIQDRAGDDAGNAGAEDLLTFFDMSPDIMLITTARHEIIRANESFHTIFQTDDMDLTGHTLLDFIHAEDKPHLRNTFQSFQLSKNARAAGIDFEARVQARDGAVYWIDWRRARRGDHFYYTGRNISSLKLQQDNIGQRQKQLAEAESIGRMGHWRWVLGNDAIEWSEELYRIFGVDQGFKPSMSGLSGIIDRRDMPRVNQAFQRAIIERKNYDMEFRTARAGGETRYVRCEGRCECNAEGEVVALFGIMQDMTERILYEKNLKEAKEAAERAYATKSQFLANMSHELRTPLNAIIGFSEVMLRQLLGPLGRDKYVEYVQGIHQSGAHLLDLITDILDMSKIEAGKYELDLEEVNIAKTIRLAMHMMEGRALDADVKITEHKFRDDTLTMVADRRALMQVMLNLLSNAIKFTRPGGKIVVGLQGKADGLWITVSDNGIGIPPNKLASITRPFEQVFSHDTRGHEGSGLGLAITKELVEMHGGVLQIQSTLDVGTTVNVRLPPSGAKTHQA